MYHPCVKSELGGRGIGRTVEEPELEPYSDTPHFSIHGGQGTVATSFLAAAYAKQQREASMVA